MLKKISKGYSKVADILEVINKNITIAFLVVLILIVFFQVACRVTTGKSFVQIEEISIVMAAWLGFFALAYSAKRGVHVRIDVFSNMLPKKAQKILTLVVNIATLAASVYLVIYGWQLAMRKMNVPLMVLPFPSGVQYLAFPVGMAFTSLFLIDHTLKAIVALTEQEEA